MSNSSSCLVCGSKDLYVSETFETYKVVSCKNCEFGIVDPIPTPEILDQLYNSEEYFAKHMDYNFDTISDTAIKKNIQKLKELYSATVSKVSFQGKKMLEIGSGGGFALAAFAEIGFETLGVETSAPASKFARERLHQQVIHTPLEDLDIKEGYDLVFLNHVLEHFLDLHAAIAKLSVLTKTKGVLYIRVPDYDSYDRKSFGKNWPAHVHYHISNFSEKSLKILLKKYGFEVFQVDKYISDRVPGLMRKVLNRLPFKSAWIDSVSGRTISVLARRSS